MIIFNANTASSDDETVFLLALNFFLLDRKIGSIC